jgi:hypothetical protein
MNFNAPIMGNDSRVAKRQIYILHIHCNFVFGRNPGHRLAEPTVQDSIVRAMPPDRFAENNSLDVERSLRMGAQATDLLEWPRSATPAIDDDAFPVSLDRSLLQCLIGWLNTGFYSSGGMAHTEYLSWFEQCSQMCRILTNEDGDRFQRRGQING